MVTNVKKKRQRKTTTNTGKYLVTMSLLIDSPNVDEAQIVSKCTKRSAVFVNAFKDAKKVSLSEINMKKV